MSARAEPQPKLVLIVDDDAGMRDVLEFAVRAEGFRAELAAGGLEAVKKMRALKPDAGIVDLMLPDYGGIELLHELRRGETGSIPLIVVTARYTSPEDRAAIMRLSNVTHYFEKPVDTDVLTRALHAALAFSRPR